MGLYKRAVLVAEHIVETRDTLRGTAKVFGIGKSTVHTDIVKTLKNENYSLYEEAAAVLEQHLLERHLRGGAATKAKFEVLRGVHKGEHT